MRKYLVTHKVGETRFTNGFIIANHYDHSLEAFGQLYERAAEAFPALKRGDVECLTVKDSGWCKGCPIVRFLLPAGTTAEGWESVDDRLPDVAW